MNIKINTEEELVEGFKKLIHISVNLQHWRKEWEEKHDAYAKDRKKIWEKQMEEYLELLDANYGKTGQYSGKELIGIFIKKV